MCQIPVRGHPAIRTRECDLSLANANTIIPSCTSRLYNQHNVTKLPKAVSQPSAQCLTSQFPEFRARSVVIRRARNNGHTYFARIGIECQRHQIT